MSHMVHCVKLGKEAPGLKFPPFPNELGKRIYDNVSQEAWDGWLRYQTMIINENRLSLADPRARQYVIQQMENYFFGEGADQISGYTPPQE
ncbi:oxidative damage protection protein [Snodgrassella alvi]|jgi:Fe-S cluster biosynthesis and repair protein YggX|uniref:Probable Fe(2+)-trafficking protein n=1 Tax=Snodgrassella alvi TaxID=1196083 RepID=A0A855FW82_9NEIS|nr:oxidative damage protection protein [Snodgrassella alvi]PIT11845.1 oxidative damage protection protein [Snodgrassella alvi]PIT23443.1 oxidative damage protection protein [Snodgrassella alvi]PIT45030.1 oxidative damage protection protein [Snodgrassella alvi]PIT57777.1 oxidative damage protection protein [Snodgrassella alvi]PIT59713.1 oxidative damage protection protein [Snodgrassella alvi]